MSEHVATLKGLKKNKGFFVGIDSDGCAFDTMEIKQKECFIPNTCYYWHLQAVSTMAREAGEFVNLYSEWRGVNRFPALVKIFDLLADRPQAVERGYKLPDIKALRDWIARETALSNATLKKEVEKSRDPVLKQTLDWSLAINQTIEKIVHHVPPFPHVRQSLEKVKVKADIMVVSATPSEALEREWAEHDLARYTMIIAGQEMGSKKEHLQHAAVGKYDLDKILMIGDALGDYKAAKANNVLYYPINPGHESDSWKRFHDEAFDKFLSGTFKGAYEDKLFAQFKQYLPSIPPWKTK
jgi:phosphoglycolate phosphatase-like HAD superfamily hydrolase